ncbi:4-hydroxy-tetrahydrodipicolinate reductase [Candidatus Solincola tengchongensis]|uniref:4-hydroxy-tetrahydrodipicolinate reductase n=1 Tax=Candidatus Solincola tengchongensis TaxID=2900693 RepID=UPI00257C9EB8|nr:4-hydroxy-tetrahydrodipicolinate reductase [Candidatus Solincola tengchongensis]
MRVGVCGAGGRMGREVCRAVVGEEDLQLVCAVDPAFEGRRLAELVPGLESDVVVRGDVGAMPEAGVEVAVDFTVAEAARANLPRLLRQGIPCVVGTTGFTEKDLEELDRAAREGGVGCLVAPNFAVGAVLMMDFARRAARYMEECEIVELHHPAKLDAPSGTARNTARLVLEARGKEEAEESEEGPRGLSMGGIHIHSVRLPGLVAHQEVIFGGKGQVLTIRHDSLDRTSFMPGVLLAVRRVGEVSGLVLGLEKVMDL